MFHQWKNAQGQLGDQPHASQDKQGLHFLKQEKEYPRVGEGNKEQWYDVEVCESGKVGTSDEGCVNLRYDEAGLFIDKYQWKRVDENEVS